MSSVQLPARSGVRSGAGPARTLGGRRLRRVALALFFGSVAVNALLGVYALLLAGDFGETEGKILGTSLCVTGALVLSLACLPAWEQRLLGAVPQVGVAASFVGFALVIVAMWSEPDSELAGKAIVTVMIVAVAATIASVVALARLPHRHRHVLTAELVLLTVAAGMLVVQVWAGLEGGWPARVFGVVAIGLAALTVSIPVLHRMARTELAAAWAHEVHDGIRFCPYCGARSAAEEATVVTCAQCGRHFSVLGSDVRP